MTVVGGCRWVCAALLAAAIVVHGPSRAGAEPAVAVGPTAGGVLTPVAPIPATAPGDSAAPDLPCLPGLGCDPLGGLGADAVNGVAQGVFRAFASFVAQGVADSLDAVSAAIAGTTTVTLDASWFQAHFDQMRGLALLVLLPMVLVGILSAVIRRDVAPLWRAGGVYLPVAIIGAAALIELTNRALALTDWATGLMSGSVASSTQSAVATLKTAVEQLTAAGAPDAGTFLAIVVLFVLLAGALLIWMELLVRTAAIYVVVLFLPLAMTGLVWKGTVQWTRRMLETLVALLLSKFVIVTVLALAAGMVTAHDGIGTVLQGATLLLLAACAPFALLRLVPVVEAGLIGQLEGLERRPVAAARRAAGSAARLAVLGAEGAASAGALSGNGGDDPPGFAGPPELGGQLNGITRPAGWPDGADGAMGPTGGGGALAGGGGALAGGGGALAGGGGALAGGGGALAGYSAPGPTMVDDDAVRPAPGSGLESPAVELPEVVGGG